MSDRRPNGTFLPGQSPGRPKGARNRLHSSFLYALAEDFERDGAAAIKICRIEEPSKYVQIVASLMPRELEVEHQSVVSDLDDAQLDDLILQIRQHLLAKREEEPMPLIEAKPTEKEVENGPFDREATESIELAGSRKNS
jgi:hypothetical protein